MAGLPGTLFPVGESMNDPLIAGNVSEDIEVEDSATFTVHLGPTAPPGHNDDQQENTSSTILDGKEGSTSSTGSHSGNASAVSSTTSNVGKSLTCIRATLNLPLL